MWLLNTETLQLEQKITEDEVKYAILSHTWDKEEVTHQEMLNPTVPWD